VLESRTTVDCKTVYFSAHGVTLGAYCIFMSNDSEGISNRFVFTVVGPDRGSFSPLDPAEALADFRLSPEVHAAVASVPAGGFSAMRLLARADDADDAVLDGGTSTGTTGSGGGSPAWHGGTSTWSGASSGSGMES
jgi:hypothetical protein